MRRMGIQNSKGVSLEGQPIKGPIQRVLEKEGKMAVKDMQEIFQKAGMPPQGPLLIL